MSAEIEDETSPDLSNVTPMPIRVGTAAEAMAELESEPDDGTPIEHLIDREFAPPPMGLDILESMDEEPAPVAAQKAGAGSAVDSYGYDKTIANEGKWVPWPKLGPAARLLLAKTQNKRWKLNLAKLRAKHADDTGQIDPVFFTEKLLGPLMVKSVFLGMDGVVVEVDQPALEDSDVRRLQLFEEFDGLQDEVLVFCTKASNFRRDPAAIVKN